LIGDVGGEDLGVLEDLLDGWYLVKIEGPLLILLDLPDHLPSSPFDYCPPRREID
jgi:hypothetical protein